MKEGYVNGSCIGRRNGYVVPTKVPLFIQLGWTLSVVAAERQRAKKDVQFKLISAETFRLNSDHACIP